MPSPSQKRKPGRLLERFEREAGAFPAIDEIVKVAKRIAGIDAFEIVAGPEQALASGLALAAGDGAERVEPLRNRRQKPLLPAHIRGDRPEQGRLRLIGAVRAAKTLNGGIRAPAGLQQIMDALSLVLHAAIGVIAAAGAARIGEDQDALVVIHEGLRLGEIGHGRTVLDLKDRLAVRIQLPHNAAAAARYFGHLIRSEMLNDLIERARHRRKACQLLDQRIASRDRFLGMDGLAVHDDGAGCECCHLIRIALVKLRRKAVAQVIEYIFLSGVTSMERSPHSSVGISDRRRSMRLSAVETKLHDGRVPVCQIGRNRLQKARRLHRRDEVIEKALLVALEGAPGC